MMEVILNCVVHNELVLLAFVIWEYIVKVSVKPFNYMFLVEFADKVKGFLKIFLYMFCVFSFFVNSKSFMSV